MNSLSASAVSLYAEQTRLSAREQLMNEYAQAVSFYEQTVLELEQAAFLDSESLQRLLAKADAAKETLHQCRKQYHLISSDMS